MKCPHDSTGLMAWLAGGRVGNMEDSADEVEPPLCLEAQTATSRGSLG